MDNPDTEPKRKLLASMERPLRRGPRDLSETPAEPAAPSAEPPPQADVQSGGKQVPLQANLSPNISVPPPAMPESPAEAAAAKEEPTEEKKGFGAWFTRKRTLKENLSKAMSDPSAAPIPRWSGKRFGLTREQAQRELDPRNQMSWLLDRARNRPVLSSIVMFLVLTIIVADLIVIIKKLNVSQWLMVNINPEVPNIEGFWTWEKRTSALAYLTQDGKVVSDQVTKSAVSGEEKLPQDKWTKPALKGGLAGIIAPSEMRQDSPLVSGLDPYVAGQGEGLGRTMVTQSDSISSPNTGKKTPTGVFLGDNLKLASVKNPVKAAADFKSAGAGNEKAPKDLKGEELVTALLSEDLVQQLADYQKNGQWVLHQSPANTKPVPHELAGLSIKGNQAVIQLVETKQSTDQSLDCGTCFLEDRVHNARATFYGEKR